VARFQTKLSSTNEIVVTKMDAARRQLRAAIRMWFAEDDPVAIHTLAHAAHEILHRLYRNRGLDNLVFDSKLIRPEFKKEFSASIKDSARFFKHANTDGTDDNTAITFQTSLNDMYIVMSVGALQKMKELLGSEEFAVLFWLKCNKPHLFPENLGQKLVPIEIATEVRKIGRTKFFHEFMKGRWHGLT
jgi:hypothetical protein